VRLLFLFSRRKRLGTASAQPTRLALLASALLMMCASAHADNSSEALQLLDSGISQFQAGKLEAARDAFLKARDLVPDKANPHRWLGLVYARMGKCSQAVWELESFIRRVPPNDPRTVEAATLRDRCKAELKPKFGALVVDSNPAEASVRLDDANNPVIGTTPYRNEAVPVGSHLVVVEKPGFQTSQKGVQVSEQGTTQVDFSLSPESIAQPVAASSPPEKKKPRYWMYGVIGGAAVLVVVALGVGLGVGLSNSSSGPTTIDPIRGM
jgi:hypothetical protein